jgi:hypothetical protein
LKEKTKLSARKKGSSDKVDDGQVEDENEDEEEKKDYHYE